MMPLVSIVGRSDSGKTRLLTRLVIELKSRGYRIASIKHGQEVHFEAGKDSQQHLAAGSKITAVAAPGQVVVIKPLGSEIRPEEIARMMGDDYDIILVEGFKQSILPKIEVHRAQNSPCLKGLEKVIAIVTDEPLETKTRCFSPDDINGIANMLEEDFIKPQRRRLTLFINGKQVPSELFPQQITTDLLLSLASSLKGAEKISSMDISLRQ